MKLLLLLYGVTLGFPDAVVPVLGVSENINVRLCDLIVPLLLLGGAARKQLLHWPKPQKKIAVAMGGFLAMCVASWCWCMSRGARVDPYWFYRVVGAIVTFYALQLAVQNRATLLAFSDGLLIGGAALIVQVGSKLPQILALGQVSYWRVKGVAGFDSWNPNALGVASSVLAFVAGIRLYRHPPKTRLCKIGLVGLTATFVLVPGMIFSRAAFVGCATAWLAFLLCTRRASALIVGALTGSVLLVLWMGPQAYALENAANIQVSTGQGFSERYALWAFALQLLSEKPLLGHGFATEIPLYYDRIGHGMPHNAFLSVAVELGIAGLLIFAHLLACFIRPLRRLFHASLRRPIVLLLGCFVLNLAIQSLFADGLYGDKHVFIGLAMIASVTGMLAHEEARCRPVLMRVMLGASARAFPVAAPGTRSRRISREQIHWRSPATRAVTTP